MNKGCWKLDDNEEAVFIDIDDEEEQQDDEDETKVYSRWSELPDLLLEKIFSYLTMREKYYASLVCRSWNRAFYLPYVWSQFVLEDTTLTRGRFNYYSGWQYVLDHFRTQTCLAKVGRSLKHLKFEPMLNFYNLYEFMNIISWFVEQSDNENSDATGVGCNIRSLKFTFPCSMNSRDEERTRLFGTGGRLLQGLKRLMGNLKKLRTLELIDLMLEPCEAKHLLDEVCTVCCLTLRSLSLVNTTKVPYQLLHAGVFLNLRELFISPQNLGDDLVELLGYTQLRHLHVVQNKYTSNDAAVETVSARAWRTCSRNNPWLCVHLEVESSREREAVWQRGAPVRSVLYRSAHTRVSGGSLLTAVELYGRRLRTYGHYSLPRFQMPRPFRERADPWLVSLCRQCPQLRALVVRERVSTATVLLVAHEARNLTQLHVRRNAVIIRCDWSRAAEWSDEFFGWLRASSRSYESAEREVSQMLGHRWRMLSDKEFRSLNVDVQAVCDEF